MGAESPHQAITSAAIGLARSEDEARRHDVDAAIVCVPLLMRNLVRTMPTNYTAAERHAYISAVKDIAVQINGATMQHQSDTGELTIGGPSLTVAPSLVDEWL